MGRTLFAKYYRQRSAFTLIELLVVIAIIAILAVVVVLTLNPAQLLAQGRDSQRLSDLATLNASVNLYATDQSGSTSFSLGAATTSYVSIFDPTAATSAGNACQGLGMPTSSAFTYHCAASSTYRNASTTGWVPVNFQAISSGAPFGSVPVDPTNQTSTGLYYTYQTDGAQYVFTSFLESQKFAKNMRTSGGIDPALEEIGSGAAALPDIGRGSVGYWPLNDGSGPSFLDWSGRANTGTFAGTTTPAWATNCNIWPSCLSFSAGYGVVNNTRPPSVPQGFTMMAWINPSSTIGTQIFASLGLPYLSEIAGGKALFSARVNGSQTSVQSNASLTPGTWYFIAGTYDNSFLSIYVNGVLDNRISAPGTTSMDSANLYLGNYSSPVYQYTGLMSDARLYNRPLSPTEISQIYSAEK